MAIKAVIHTNQSSIDRVLGVGVPVVLAFWSPQSRQDDPGILEDLAVDFAGRALIARVNAADEAALMTRFKVTQVPSFVFIKDGRAEATIAGPLITRDVTGLVASSERRRASPRNRTDRAYPQTQRTKRTGRSTRATDVDQASAIDRRQLRTGDQRRSARSRRFLGRMVRTLPHGWPQRGTIGPRVCRACHGRKT